MTLYNLRTDGDQYRVTKFTNDLKVESSYLIGRGDRNDVELECDCPAGHHFSCRHRQMFPDLLPIVGTKWFWNFEGGFTCDCNGNRKSSRVQVEDEPEPETVGEPEALIVNYDIGDKNEVPPAPPPIPSSWRRI
jgi:hypothetical protein